MATSVFFGGKHDLITRCPLPGYSSAILVHHSPITNPLYRKMSFSLLLVIPPLLVINPILGVEPYGIHPVLLLLQLIRFKLFPVWNPRFFHASTGVLQPFGQAKPKPKPQAETKEPKEEPKEVSTDVPWPGY